jgi:hypothetical protein
VLLSGGRLLVPRTPAGRFVAVLAALACSAALAGCQANPEPAPLPSESPSATAPSEADSPSPAPPTMPAEARGTSEKSAKAFVRFWIEALNYAGPTGDTEQLNEFTDAACSECKAIIRLIQNVHHDGGYIHGKGWAVQSVSTVAFGESGGRVFDAVVKVHPQEIRMSATDTVETFKGGRRLKTFWLKRRQGTWLITRLDQSQ